MIMNLMKIFASLLASLPVLITLSLVLRDPPPDRIKGFADARILETPPPNTTTSSNIEIFERPAPTTSSNSAGKHINSLYQFKSLLNSFRFNTSLHPDSNYKMILFIHGTLSMFDDLISLSLTSLMDGRSFC